MRIRGIEGLTGQELSGELANGGSFIIYQYCISIVIMTFKRSSDVYLIKRGKSKLIRGLGFTIISLLFGWWGIPWGPIYTISSIVKNSFGGTDVTNEIISSLNSIE